MKQVFGSLTLPKKLDHSLGKVKKNETNEMGARAFPHTGNPVAGDIADYADYPHQISKKISTKH